MPRRRKNSDDPARARYADNLGCNIRPRAVASIFRSMVDLSDNGNLLEKFLELRCARMFMYGERNAGLTYLTELQRRGVQLAEIPRSSHFPMYSNPGEMWRQIAAFITAVEEKI